MKKIFFGLGVLFLVLVLPMISAETCYQETADASHPNDALYSTYESCDLNYGGGYEISINENDETGYYYGTMDILYRKPIGATSSSLWKVKYGEIDAYEAYIPETCWNYNPDELYLRFYTGDEVIDGIHYITSYGECYDGEWQLAIEPAYETGTIFTDGDSSYLYDGDWTTSALVWRFNEWDTEYLNPSTGSVYEEAMIWDFGTANSDEDGDGVLDDEDNCPFIANPNQEDFDEDELGDACDEDDDNDGILDEPDKCEETLFGEIQLADTGCSCNQILDLKPGEDTAENREGCTKGLINVFTSAIGWAQDLFEEV